MRLLLALELKEAWVNKRHFIALPEEQQKPLRAQFAEFRELAEAGTATGFHQLVVSVFDHSLSEEEAIEELSEVSVEAQRARDAKLAAFVRSLASRNRCYLVKLKGRHHECSTFRRFTSDDARDRWLTPQPYDISDEWRFCLVTLTRHPSQFLGSMAAMTSMSELWMFLQPPSRKGLLSMITIFLRRLFRCFVQYIFFLCQALLALRPSAARLAACNIQKRLYIQGVSGITWLDNTQRLAG